MRRHLSRPVPVTYAPQGFVSWIFAALREGISGIAHRIGASSPKPSSYPAERKKPIFRPEDDLQFRRIFGQNGAAARAAVEDPLGQPAPGLGLAECPATKALRV